MGETTPGITTVAETTPQITTIAETTPKITTMGETTPGITTMAETTPEITTIAETTPKITTMAETTPEITTIAETTPEITTMAETTPGGETENTMTMDTYTTTQKPDNSKRNVGIGAGTIVAIVFGCLAGVGVIGVILIVVRSLSNSITRIENKDVVNFGQGVIETTPEITTMGETTPGITTVAETTPEITTIAETTPKITTMAETTPEITTMAETTPGGETENTMTMDTYTTTQKPDNSKRNVGIGAGTIVAIVFGCLAGVGVIGVIVCFIRQRPLTR
uniref:Uncharacterized protein n=1 Tax=Trichobilharzia regenti TaxID=157069 RepID=A0AA85IYG1_TRIRE|nr:unnamed protein product [Trichobilharzia regenti]